MIENVININLIFSFHIMKNLKMSCNIFKHLNKILKNLKKSYKTSKHLIKSRNILFQICSPTARWPSAYAAALLVASNPESKHETIKSFNITGSASWPKSICLPNSPTHSRLKWTLLSSFPSKSAAKNCFIKIKK